MLGLSLQTDSHPPFPVMTRFCITWKQGRLEKSDSALAKSCVFSLNVDHTFERLRVCAIWPSPQFELIPLHVMAHSVYRSATSRSFPREASKASECGLLPLRCLSIQTLSRQPRTPHHSTHSTLVSLRTVIRSHNPYQSSPRRPRLRRRGRRTVNRR